MKKLIMAKLIFLFMCNYAFACEQNLAEVPTFTSNTFVGRFEPSISIRSIDITSSPLNYGTIMQKCNGTGTSTFQISTTNINTSDSITNAGRTHYRIRNTSISPSVANHPDIYIAFKVRDNQNNATLYNVGTSPITFFTGASDTRGMRLEDVRIRIRGSDLTPGSYVINNLILGTFTAKGSGNDPSASQTVTLKNLRFTIGQPTCVVGNQSVTLPSVPTTSFTSTNTRVGTREFTITATCSNSAMDTLYRASITDSNSIATSNTTGILVNGIAANNGGSNAKIILTDTSDRPIPIGSTSNPNKFEFGTMNSNYKVSKAFKVAYIPSTIPVTVGGVQSNAMITLSYD